MRRSASMERLSPNGKRTPTEIYLPHIGVRLTTCLVRYDLLTNRE